MSASRPDERVPVGDCAVQASRPAIRINPIERSNYLLVPFELKQLLGAVDEFETPATVFGVTRGGEIVG